MVKKVFFDFFLEKVILYGEVAIKSRYLEAKPLKFSPPKSLCGTVGSPWVSLASEIAAVEYRRSSLLQGPEFEE